MPIQYVCLGCREEMVLPDQKAGQLCACPRCRLKFLAPPPTAGRPPNPGGAASRGASGGGAPPLYPAAGRGSPVRLSAPVPEPKAAPTRDEAPAGGGLFGMGSSGGGGGLFGQADVQVGALFGGAGQDEEEPAQEEAVEEEVEEEATDHAAGPQAGARPAFPAPGRPGSAPPGYRAPQQAPYPGYHAPPQSPPTGYPQPYGAPQQPYGAPQPAQQPYGAPQPASPQGYPPGYPPQGYPPGYGPPPGYVPGYPGYPGYPPQGGGYPYPQYPGYPPGYPHQPTPAGGVPIGGGAPPPHEPAASGPAPDLISMDDVYARKAPAPSMSAGGRGCRLVVLDGLPEGTEFHLPAGKIYDIGRDKEADVKILSTSVSRRQARIDATGAGPVLIDCGSANGTQVNGELVGRHPLREGDLIKMGKVLFRYQSA